VSDYVRKWFYNNMPRSLLHDFPIRTAHRFGALNVEPHFLGFNLNRIYKWTCDKGAKHVYL
jgi:hypothetical protein